MTSVASFREEYGAEVAAARNRAADLVELGHADVAAVILAAYRSFFSMLGREIDAFEDRLADDLATIIRLRADPAALVKALRSMPTPTPTQHL